MVNWTQVFSNETFTFRFFLITDGSSFVSVGWLAWDSLIRQFSSEYPWLLAVPLLSQIAAIAKGRSNELHTHFRGT